MYPKIFDKTETEFSNNGIGFLSDVKKILVTEERNGGFYVEMEYPLNGVNSEYLKYDYIILVKPNPIDRPQPFRIYDTKKSKNNHSITVKANHVTFDDSQNFLVDFTRNKTTASTVLTQMRENRTSKNKITYSTDITTPITVDWSKRSPVNALAGEQGSFIQTLNSEIKRDMWSVTANASRGRQSSFVARDEKGLTDFDFEEDVSGVVTKIYPFKIYKPEGSDEDKTITLKEKFITSENADKYPFEKIAYLDLSQDETVTDEASLRKVAQKQFTQEHIDLPKISGTLKIINLSKNPEYDFIGELSSVLLCDYIWCVSKTIKEKVQVQVNKVVYNPIIEDYDSLDVGMKKQSLGQSITNSINKVQNEVNKVQNQVNNIVISADGTESFYSENAPKEPEYDLNEGDIWFQPLADGSINSWVWNDTQKIWQPIFNKEDFDSAFNDVNSGVDAAKQQAQEASDKADQIVIDFNKQIGDVQTDINGAKEDAASALSDAQKAIQQADFNNQEITNIEKQQSDDGKRLTVVETNYNGLNQTVTDLNAKTESYHVQLSGQISDVIQNQNSISQRVQTAEGTIESIETMTGSNTIVNTIKGHQQQITDVGSSVSKLTQTAEGIVASVGNINNTIGVVYPNGDFEDTDFNKYYTGTGSITSNQELVLQLSADKRIAFLNEYIPVNNNDALRVIFDAKFSGTPQIDAFALFVHQYDKDKREINNIYDNIFKFNNYADTVYHLQQTRTLAPATKYIRIEWVAWGGHGNGMLFISNITLHNGQNTLSGQIGLLKDDINLKVSKNDVVNQINVSTEGILIDGQKVHITGQTSIDNAVITAAMIKDISADKITTGTLNAANVKIVNLDVNKLTGDYSRFLKTAWEDEDSYSEITPNGLRFYTLRRDSWSKSTYLDINATKITWQSSNKAYHYIKQSNDTIYKNTLTLGAVANGDTNPTGIHVRTWDYDTMSSVNGTGHYSGRYTFVGSLKGTCLSDNMRKAELDIAKTKDKEPGDTVPVYALRVASDNDIIINVAGDKVGDSVRFSSGIGDSTAKFETRITNNQDNGVGMFIVSKPTYNRTYSNAANLFITSNGYIGRSTSARKYKQDIEYIDNIDEAKKTLDIQPAEWADKKQMMSHARVRAGISNPEDEERLTRRYIGFIADDFADAGFEKLIIRDKTGAVEEFQYNRLSVYHHQMIKDLYNQIDILKNEIKELKGDN